jgi:hypothetical protein
MNYLTVLSVINGAADTLEFLYESLDVFCEHFVALCVLLYVAGEFTGTAFYTWHASWIGTDWQHHAPAVAVVPPAVNPLFVEAAAIEAAYSVRTLQATVGVRKARTKHQQIASFIAR